MDKVEVMEYRDHIININNIIEEECYQNGVMIYQNGTSGTLQKFLIEMNPKLTEHLFYKELKEEDGGEDGGEEGDEAEWNLADDRYKVDVAKKHPAAAVTDDA